MQRAAMQQRNQVSADTHVVEYIPFDAGEHFLMVSSHQAHETVPAQRRPLRPRAKDSSNARSALVHMSHTTRIATQHSAAARTAFGSGQYSLRSGAGVARVLPQPWNRMGQGECIDARHVSSSNIRVEPWNVSLVRLHHFALRLGGITGTRAG